ncbi:MAG TPA: hypothetical protein VFO41_15375 [Alphaproteobacteria bacterium]|nr:hypothetical protein [Alphaproteobacteria bacterium]
MAAVHQIGAYRVSDQVLGAVREASARTGVDFAYMMAKAARESGFDADIRAATSSATGLYQFIDQTWLGMVKAHGEAHGLGLYADRIVEKPGGGFAVSDPDLRREILGLRTDPRLNALMAGEYAQDNMAHLERTVGGEIGPTELYLAHFLGAGGAETFLTELRANPHAPADAIFPEAAAANRGVFYENGRPRSLSEVYDGFDGKVRRDMALAGEVPVDGASGGEASPFWRPDTRFAGGIPRNLGGIGGDFGLSGGPATPAAVAQLGEKQLSLWTVLTLSSLPVPGNEGQDGVTAAKAERSAGALFG